jgi:hypothetical protein
MASQPHSANVPLAAPPNAPAGAATPPAPSPYPGGMASDPAVALANEIVTSIKGAFEKARLELVDEGLVGSVAQSIRRFADAEIGKATGGSGLVQNKASEK